MPQWTETPDIKTLLDLISKNRTDDAVMLLKIIPDLSRNEKEIITLLTGLKKSGIKRVSDLQYHKPFYKASAAATRMIQDSLPECTFPGCSGKVVFSGYYVKIHGNETYYLFICTSCLRNGSWWWAYKKFKWDYREDKKPVPENNPLLEQVRKLTIG